ncbi:uncharacterized protein LOC114799594 isoform X1 [Denticeps clupeoides]|uniref:F-box domain-containing protein n=1 Tax=Denticeps clupeoides TaxID=299321 RepID=A0AAY4BW47_9TELE|nr:uncharacterized protein LOC114799594 isoform X1 [Denticeps clupeoides]
MARTLLPEEIWLHVFQYLSATDKGHVRTCCKHFKRLIDHHSLWRGDVVVLKAMSSYSRMYWNALRRRRIRSVVVQKASLKEWKLIAASLPSLRSITVDLCNDVAGFAFLRHFAELEKLVIRRCRLPTGLAGMLAPLSQLTHLCICEVHCVPRSEIVSAVSRLSNLTVLHYHEGNAPIPRQTFHDMLRCLPNLTELSLKFWTMFGSLPDNYFSLQKTSPDKKRGHAGLTRLELLNYMDPALSPFALEHLPTLQHLTVQYRDRAMEPSMCHLKVWLNNLTHLTGLSVTQGYPLSIYAQSLPVTLKCLTLTRVMAEPEALRIIGKAVPGLQHFHLDQCSSHCSSIKEIPKLFPLLQTLNLRYLNVTEEEFLKLSELQKMKKLVILDAHPASTPYMSQLISKLRVKTNYRMQVITARDTIDPAACYCSLY